MLNRTQLIGRLGRDPELRYTQDGVALARLAVATHETWKDDQGQKQERTEWHRIVVWGASAENCAQYLSKGRPVYIEGSLRTRQWDDKEGHKRSTTEVIAQRVQFLGSPNDRRGSSSSENTSPGFDAGSANNTPFDAGSGPDDVPF